MARRPESRLFFSERQLPLLVLDARTPAVLAPDGRGAG
jgi:hypothetical protein